MRLRRATIENFKRFAPPGIELDFCNTALGEVADRFLVLGDNGSGKTTVLQAIAVTLALAAHKISDVGGLWWKGWMPERYFAHDNPVVQVEVHDPRKRRLDAHEPVCHSSPTGGSPVPVSILLCEDEINSPDHRLLRAILPGIPLVVHQSGGKDGDSDFPRHPETWSPSELARPWRVKKANVPDVMIGWQWPRKELRRPNRLREGGRMPSRGKSPRSIWASGGCKFRSTSSMSTTDR